MRVVGWLKRPTIQPTNQLTDRQQTKPAATLAASSISKNRHKRTTFHSSEYMIMHLMNTF
jgi:hypothetical protein